MIVDLEEAGADGKHEQEKPFDFILMDLEGGNRSKITIQCKYIPVPITLEARESVNSASLPVVSRPRAEEEVTDMGMLTVMVDNAKGLKAADRNGYSDPYIEFKLNGLKVRSF